MSYKTNLTAYYRFESGALTTDSSGNSNTLTAISDPSSIAGKFGGAVYFDADDAYSRADDADFEPTGNFSIGCWIKTTSTGVVAMQNMSINTNWSGWRIRVNAAGTIGFASAKNSGTVAGTDFGNITSTGAYNDDSWHQVIGTWDGSNLNLYVDGVSDAAAVAWANAPVYAATTYIRLGCGNKSGANEEFLTGSMDEAFVLKGTALSATQVLRLYQTKTSSFLLNLLHFKNN